MPKSHHRHRLALPKEVDDPYFSFMLAHTLITSTLCCVDTVAVGQVFYQVPDGTIKPEQPQYAPTSGMDLKYAAPEIQNFGFDDTNEGQGTLMCLN